MQACRHADAGVHATQCAGAVAIVSGNADGYFLGWAVRGKQAKDKRRERGGCGVG